MRGMVGLLHHYFSWFSCLLAFAASLNQSLILSNQHWHYQTDPALIMPCDLFAVSLFMDGKVSGKTAFISHSLEEKHEWVVHHCPKPLGQFGSPMCL